MYRVLNVLLAVVASATPSSGEEPCLGQCTGIGSDKACTFTFMLNLYASETGYFRVKECGEEVNPTLGIEKNVHYTFEQEGLTNYMHPMGFKYGDYGDSVSS